MKVRRPVTPAAAPVGTGRHHSERYILRLFVAGLTERAYRAVDNIRRICETHLPERYDLEIIDVYQQPALTKAEQIIAAPTLIKKLPLPARRIIGDMSKIDRVLAGLDLPRHKA